MHIHTQKLLYLQNMAFANPQPSLSRGTKAVSHPNIILGS